jgi:hypothetical protein
MTRDQEPRLKYNVLGADVELILSRQEASAFCASDKLRVVGCCNGGVYVVDFEGHKVLARTRFVAFVMHLQGQAKPCTQSLLLIALGSCSNALQLHCMCIFKSPSSADL